MAQASLAYFISQFIPSEPLYRDLSAVNGLVTGVTVQQGDAMQVSCLVERPIPAALLCRAEEQLEQELALREVLIRQTYPQNLAEQEASRYAVELVPWLLRHLWHKDALSASMLRQAQFSAGTDHVSVAFADASQAVFAAEHLEQLQLCFSGHVSAQTRFCLAGEGSACSGHLAAYARDLFTSHTEQARQVHQAAATPDSNGSANRKNGSAGNGHTQETPAEKKPEPRRRHRRRKVDGLLWGRINPELKRVPIDSLSSETGLALIEGQVFDLEMRPVSEGTRILFKFCLTDLSSSVSCILFARPDEEAFLTETLQDAYIRLAADISFEAQYSKDLQARVTGLQAAEPQPCRRDEAAEKRVELHAHTQMSAKDAICDARELVRLAAGFGHEAVAITDHGVVQAFPDAAEACAGLKKQGKAIKVIYGMEGYLVDDLAAVAWQCEETTLDEGYVAFDVETTGLDPAAGRLIEVAAVHFLPDGAGGFVPGERLVSLINPGIPLPPEVIRLTGITAEMIAGAPDPLTVLNRLKAWAGDKPLVAHNAFFDLGFLRYEGQRTLQATDPPLKFNPPLIDTLALSRLLLADLPQHKLGNVAAHLGISLDQAHRAEADALACGAVFAALWQKSGASHPADLNRLAGQRDPANLLEHQLPVYHIILLAADRLGLYHLYRIVSQSHLQHFHMRPRIPRSLLQYFRHGLVVGSACESGEIYQAVRQVFCDSGKSEEEALRRLNRAPHKLLGRFYDYFEIQPLENNAFYLRDPQSGLDSLADLQAVNRLIYSWGRQLKRPVCATCDVHFLEERDSEFRRILMTDMGYADAAEQAPLFFRTTEEMLQAFAWMGEAAAREVVITHPRAIADRVAATLAPFPDGSFPPLIDQAADDVRNLTWGQARAIYGRDGQLPEIVRQRVERELASIIDNGFAVMYYIAHKLVKKSNEDGYIVGSRGSVGSSLVATLCGITEVNPLPPHYVCQDCRYSAFDETGTFGSGYDLPAKACPGCGKALLREGQDIPFETFLGFTGDKQPDIDLNFSGEYQARAHKFIEEMFGASHTFRAGTISSFAEKNAQAIVRKYHEAVGQYATQAEVSRLARGLIGIKRTTGQHPGGIVVVPREREIYDFTPVQHPADKSVNGTITTHFDFNAMHDTILKLDILGHDDPTMLKMLGDLTGVDVAAIPIPDQRVMSLFQSTEALGIPQEQAIDGCATLGLPEMGTFMAREMIHETRPARFYDLVQLMGLSHGTDVWKGNAQDLIRSGTCTIEEVIGCRDSIMTGLIYNGLPPKEAFDIMERVRKGKGLSGEQESLMRQHAVPEWYIESCKKIRYMFPKAHAAAYTISSLRIAWFKVNHPEAYYCAYFTVRADEFDSLLMCRPPGQIRKARQKMRQELRDGGDRELRIYYIMEIVEEMQQRGIDFAPVDLHQSDATRFVLLAPGKILPPLNAIPSVSAATAAQIVQARAAGPFRTRDELARRAAIGQSVIEHLAAAGCLEDLPESSQMDLFALLG